MSIVDYLEKRGHQPLKVLSGGKLLYLCPFPDHKETKPSFVVYTHAEQENFYCFGCQRNHNIINLVSGLEDISFKEALLKLSSGIVISDLEGIDIEIERIEKQFQTPPMSLSLGEELMSISNMCRKYLGGVENDVTEQEIIDKMLSIVDQDVRNLDFDNISETVSNLPSILLGRREKYEKMKIEKMREQYASQKSDLEKIK